MVVDFALAMLAAIDRGAVTSAFRGIVSGDAWISGVDSVDSWGPFLRATDLLDDVGLAAVMVPRPRATLLLRRATGKRPLTSGAQRRAPSRTTRTT